MVSMRDAGASRSLLRRDKLAPTLERGSQRSHLLLGVVLIFLLALPIRLPAVESRDAGDATVSGSLEEATDSVPGTLSIDKAVLFAREEELPGFAPGTLPAEPCVSRPGQGPQMILIESGRFVMGSPAGEEGRLSTEGPQHPVAVVRPFALARCETTVGEFGRFVAETGYRTDAEKDGGGCYTVNADDSGVRQRKDANWRNPGFAQSEDHPVVCVSFNDARAYADWLSLRTGAAYRLPTEAEWEYAARAGRITSRFWGDDPTASCIYSNGADQAAKARFPDWEVADCDDGAEFTAPAGRYRRNPFGLSDMSGNVWEWVEDCWHESYEGAPNDGSAWLETGGGDCARRVLRGGGWDTDPWWLRSAFRNGGPADDANFYVGIRLARTF